MALVAVRARDTFLLLGIVSFSAVCLVFESWEGTEGVEVVFARRV